VEKLLALRDSFARILTHIRDAGAEDHARVSALLKCLQLLNKIISNAKVSMNIDCFIYNAV